jgi:hypothetical protein
MPGGSEREGSIHGTELTTTAAVDAKFRQPSFSICYTDLVSKNHLVV